MPGLSNTVENKILDALLSGAAYSVSSPSLALTSVAVTDADTPGTITKVAYTGYADLALVNATHFDPAAGGAKVNKAALVFASNPGPGSSTAVGFAILAGGDVVLYGSVSSLVIGANITPQFDIGTLTLSAD
jgi:hypothetical protein